MRSYISALMAASVRNDQYEVTFRHMLLVYPGMMCHVCLYRFHGLLSCCISRFVPRTQYHSSILVPTSGISIPNLSCCRPATLLRLYMTTPSESGTKTYQVRSIIAVGAPECLALQFLLRSKTKNVASYICICTWYSSFRTVPGM